MSRVRVQIFYLWGMAFVPVIDVSHHQKAVDFAKARANGVEGVIIRATNGNVVDSFLERNIVAARNAGFTDDVIGFYAFCNPKSTSGRDGGRCFVDAVRRAFGHVDTFLMMDAEQYDGEPGRLPVITGAAYAAWLDECIATTRELAPPSRIVLYTGASFWNGVVPDTRFAEFDTIIARYPIWPSKILGIEDRQARESQLEAWLATSPKPPTHASGWEEWILARKQRPPRLTGLGQWSGWQFSAQFNCAGPTYGATSRDLDLNIVRDEAWERWTRSTPRRVERPDAPRVVIDQPIIGPNATLQPNAMLRRNEARTSANGLSTFIHQGDGNVVLLKDGQPRWFSGTAGAETDVLIMQPDGNLVLIGTDGHAVWNSATHQHPGAHLEVRDVGHAVIVAADGTELWVKGGGNAGQSPPRTTTALPGEGWISIAARALGDSKRWRELAAVNGGEDRVLHPGDVLTLPL